MGRIACRNTECSATRSDTVVSTDGSHIPKCFKCGDPAYVLPHEFETDELHHTWSHRVFRWKVPVNNEFHPIGGGKVLLVESRTSGMVDVWTEELASNQTDQTTAPKRSVRAFETGQPLGDDNLSIKHIGSCLDGSFVWHLYEKR